MPTVQVHFITSPPDQMDWVHVPDTELEVLGTLGKNKWIGPEISRATQGKISPASVHVLLQRLEKRGLVKRHDATESLRGVDLKRVEYHSLIDQLYNPMDKQNKTAR